MLIVRMLCSINAVHSKFNIVALLLRLCSHQHLDFNPAYNSQIRISPVAHQA